ncbi:MAG: hypothetical protein P4L50_29080, partial [Anaerolineaceae bacterium]|nr:hypothetical protein [Anaerolineaceae bacterium]
QNPKTPKPQTQCRSHMTKSFAITAWEANTGVSNLLRIMHQNQSFHMNCEEMDETSYVVEMLSFVTNLREPLGWILVSKHADLSLMLTEAEVERVAIRVSTSISFGIDEWLRFCEAIRSNPTVSSLILCRLEDEDITREPRLIPTLANALRGAKSLRKLAVQDASLSPSFLKAVTELLDPGSDIQVALEFCRQNEKLTAQPIEMLRKIPSLRKLYVSSMSIDVAAFSNGLRNDWPNLSSLALVNTQLDAEGGKAIGDALEKIAFGLHTLDLNLNHLGDSGVTAIVEGLFRAYSHTAGKRGALKKLRLCSNDIDSKGWIQVAQLMKFSPHLTHIDMRGNSIGSAGTAFGDSLKSCAATLKGLELSQCSLDARTIIAISRSLAGSCSLPVLNIDISQLKNSAEAMRTFARELIAGSRSLEELSIISSCLDGPGIEALSEGIMQNNSLKKIDLHDNDGVGAAISPMLEAILHLNLTVLSLRSCGIGEEGGKAVGKFVALSSSLRHLDVCANRIHADVAKEISMGVAQSGSLEQLWLSLNDLGDEGAKSVAEWVIEKSKTVQWLCISNNGVGAEGAKAIAKAIVDAGKETALMGIYVGDMGAEVRSMMESTLELQKNSSKIYFSDVD